MIKVESLSLNEDSTISVQSEFCLNFTQMRTRIKHNRTISHFVPSRDPHRIVKAEQFSTCNADDKRDRERSYLDQFSNF